MSSKKQYQLILVQNSCLPRIRAKGTEKGQKIALSMSRIQTKTQTGSGFGAKMVPKKVHESFISPLLFKILDVNRRPKITS